MFIIVDVVILAILALCILLGYKKGLAKCLIGVLAFFIAVIISVILFKPVSAVVTSSTQIDENIQTSIVSFFEKQDETNEKTSDESDDKKNNVPIITYISEQVENATEEKKNEIVSSAAKEISLKIVDVLCFIGIFIAARIALIFVKVIADLITRLPIIKQCDKLGGVIYGILQACVIIFIGLALITFISTITSQYTVLELVNKSYIGSILNNNNILLNIIF